MEDLKREVARIMPDAKVRPPIYDWKRSLRRLRLFGPSVMIRRFNTADGRVRRRRPMRANGGDEGAV